MITRVNALLNMIGCLMLAAISIPAAALESSPEDRLIRAASADDLPTLRELLKAGVDPNAGRKSDAPPILSAANGKRWEIVLALANAKADPNVKTRLGETPLFLAASAGRSDVVQVLAAAGADPSPRVSIGGGRSALYWVLQSRNLDMALLLVKLGANGNDATDYQDTPLRLASAGRTDKHLELVRALLAQSADTERGQVPKARMEVSCPVQTDEVCITGTRVAPGTALGIAAAHGSAEIVKALLDAHAYVNARQDGLKTPLMIAAAQNCTEVVRLLLNAGADVHKKDGEERTALMLASQQGHREVVELLNAAGAGAAAGK